MAMDEEDAVVQVFFIREGKMIGRDHFYLRIAADATPSQILLNFVKQFYAGTPFIPSEIMLQSEIEDADIIEEWLSGRRKQKVHIRVPKKGTKEKLVELAWKMPVWYLPRTENGSGGRKDEPSELFTRWKNGWD